MSDITRRFGVAQVEGSQYFDYDQILIFLSRISECKKLTWEVPVVAKVASFYTTSVEEQLRAVTALKKKFGDGQILYFFKHGFSLEWSGDFLTEETGFPWPWIEKRVQDKTIINDVVVWFGNNEVNADKIKSLRNLNDVVCKSLRFLKITPVELFEM